MKPGLYIYELTTVDLREDGSFDIGWDVGPHSLNCSSWGDMKLFLRGCLYLGEV